jgi:hypothetical protein
MKSQTLSSRLECAIGQYQELKRLEKLANDQQLYL